MLRSRHATHDQLWQFFQLKARENPAPHLQLADASGWSQHGLITRLNVKYAKRGWVYAISESGRRSFGRQVAMGRPLSRAKAFKQLDDPVVLHSLDLNDVHLTLIRAANWFDGSRNWKSYASMN